MTRANFDALYEVGADALWDAVDKILPKQRVLENLPVTEVLQILNKAGCNWEHPEIRRCFFFGTGRYKVVIEKGETKFTWNNIDNIDEVYRSSLVLFGLWPEV